jgi:hypothetical protein
MGSIVQGDPETEEKAQRYRDEAARARRLAEATSDRSARKQLLLIAEQYEGLVRQLERGPGQKL